MAAQNVTAELLSDLSLTVVLQLQLDEDLQGLTGYYASEAGQAPLY